MRTLFLGARPRHGPRSTAFVWTLCIVLAILFISVGLPKLMAQQMQVESFRSWGYPAWLMYVVGAFEVFFGLLLLVPATRFLAACALALELVAAVFTYVRVGAATQAVLAGFLLGLAVIVAWMERPAKVRQAGAAKTT